MLLVSFVFAAASQTIGKPGVNVRSNPDLNSKGIFELFSDYPITGKNHQNNWGYFTDWKNQAGWVRDDLVWGE